MITGEAVEMFLRQVRRLSPEDMGSVLHIDHEQERVILGSSEIKVQHINFPLSESEREELWRHDGIAES